MKHITWLKDLNKSNERLVGKKAALLGEIFSLASVPAGFVILPSAFSQFITSKSWELNIVLNNNSLNKVEKSERIRGIIRSITLPKEIKTEISDIYTDFCASLFAKNEPHAMKPIIPVMVRTTMMISNFTSSSTLWASGLESLLKSLESCWINLFDEQAIEYIRSNKINVEEIKIIELVQSEIYTHKSGIIYTLNPDTGEEDEISINTCWGLPDYFYLDEKQPTHYLITKNLDIIERDHRQQGYAYLLNRKTGEKLKRIIPEEERSIKVMNDEEAISLARLAMKLEEHFSELLKIEFATYKDKSYIIQVDIIPKVEIKDQEIEIREAPREEPDKPEKPSFLEDSPFEIQIETAEYTEEEPQDHSEHDFETELSELFAKYNEKFPELSGTLKKLEESILKVYKAKK